MEKVRVKDLKQWDKFIRLGKEYIVMEITETKIFYAIATPFYFNRESMGANSQEWVVRNGVYDAPKPILRLSVEGYELASYRSIREASTVTGLPYTGISNVINGYYKTSGGFRWKRA